VANDRHMRFFVDETSFYRPDDVNAETLEEHLNEFIQLLHGLHRTGEKVYKWSELEQVMVRSDVHLWQLLYNRSAGVWNDIDRDIRLGLQQALNRCLHWDESLPVDVPPDVWDAEVTIAGVPCRALTVVAVAAMVLGNHGACCLAVAGHPERSGIQDVTCGEAQCEVYFATHDNEVVLFYRTIPEIEDLAPVGYMKNAEKAFPSLVWAPNLAAQIPRFKTSYIEVRPLLTKHLGVLNDHFQQVHRQHKDKTDEFIGEYGIDASPERGKTHKNKAAMKQRTLVIDGISLVCEWHTKLMRHIDRIYFHPGDARVKEGRLVVGFFVDHFDL